MITAETKRVCASSLMVLHRVTLCALHQIYQVGSSGLSVLGQPNARIGAPQTTNKFWGTLGALLPETQRFELALHKALRAFHSCCLRFTFILLIGLNAKATPLQTQTQK